jgi:uncharacterized membrane protein
MALLFSGIHSLTVIHPMVVHFPIAYLMTSIAVELAFVVTKRDGLRVAAHWLVYLGALSAMAAVGAGYLAAETLGHDSPGHDLVHDHRNIMVAMTIGLFLTAIALAALKIFREGKFRKALLPILLVLGGVMAFGADKGGTLVYTYGTGVNPQASQSMQPRQGDQYYPGAPTHHFSQEDDHHEKTHGGDDGQGHHNDDNHAH